ncbi:MAG: hypothetical protein HKN73_00395 [Gemmatimonadetes bacterium]|nr:hypothetical protein [Gemmatimonadota bacterium]
MTKRCGIWIDRREAVLIHLDGDRHRVERVESDVEAVARRKGGSAGITSKAGRSRGKAGGPAGGMDDALPERKIGRRTEQALRRYYQSVEEAAGEVTALVLFGPGQARDELAEIIEAAAPGRKSIWSEPSERLTEPQMVAFVKRFFEPPDA